jgi:hypothetical protein
MLFNSFSVGLLRKELQKKLKRTHRELEPAFSQIEKDRGAKRLVNGIPFDAVQVFTITVREGDFKDSAEEKTLAILKSRGTF